MYFRCLGQQGPNIAAHIKKLAFFTVLATGLTACASTNDGNLWQGGDVLVEARQQKVEKELEEVSENYQELVDRFHELERLYVQLANRINAQNARFDAQKDADELALTQSEALRGIQQTLAGMATEIERLGERVYTVELANAVKADEAQTAIDITEASVDEASAENVAVEEVPVENAVTEDTLPDVPAIAQNEGETALYGVHLASYRSHDQLEGGWSSLVTNYSELEQLTPLVFVQQQEAIGTFLRLIAGPFNSETEASDACERIQQVSSDQYCRVSGYQGEVITTEE